jgi:EAL domain-containing protein (putative c-di-GMP-specific phosphodiesterase class I)/GGDEF domain-containing protein
MAAIDDFTRILNQHQCVSIRIEIKKDLPVTAGKEYLINKKNVSANLVDLINAEDLTVLLGRIDELTMIGSGSLRVNCRFIPDNKRYYICCDMRREKRFAAKSSDYLYGVIMDVDGFYDSKNSDPAQQELMKKELNKFSGNGDVGIVEIIGMEQLSKIQIPLNENHGLRSVILDEAGRFICTADPKKTVPNIGEYQYSNKIYIKINHVVYAVWVIASNDISLIDRYKPIHEVLAESLSKLANSYVMLYNEMTNTEQANKLLSETIEQQMLLNGIYSKVLNERNSVSTMHAVVNLTGDFLKLDRIVVCEDAPDVQKYNPVYDWSAADDSIPTSGEKSKISGFNYSDYPKLIEELGYYETYFSNNPKHDVLGLEFSSYVASNLNGDGSKYGMIIYIINNPERVLTHAEKRLLRSVSQIIAAVIMRCMDNDVLDATNKRLHYLAYHDQVLGVKNKVSVSRDVSSAMAGGQPGAVVAFNIPNIKNINNFVGDSTDELIKEILKSVSLYEELSAEPYRYSDDVFMVLLRNADPNSAKKFCDNLIERFNQPWSLNGVDYSLEITAGVALYPEAAATAEELCRIAVMSMQKAMEYGENSYAFFSHEFENPEIDGYHCAQVLRNAIKNNMQGLTIKYLPVYSNCGKIISCEALLSLCQEEESLKDSPQTSYCNYPSHIIMQIAEKMGLDVIINSWVIKKACEFCKKVRDSQPAVVTNFPIVPNGFQVSVSATARSLFTGTIVTMVKNALEDTVLPEDGLAVQFSERIVAVNYDRFIATLRELRQIGEKGVSVILDNVGSYYTAFSLLRHSGISAAKTDVTLFTGKIDEISESYVNNIVKLAKNNAVSVGVKSVENESQLELLQQADWYQGSLYSRAMEEEEFIGLMGET